MAIDDGESKSPPSGSTMRLWVYAVGENQPKDLFLSNVQERCFGGRMVVWCLIGKINIILNTSKIMLNDPSY